MNTALRSNKSPRAWSKTS